MTIIISAFPSCGKTHYHQHGDKYEVFSTLDSDSSKFSWILDGEGKSTGVRNPDFPSNYISHIKSNLGKVSFIFVSSHDDVRQALEDNNLPYITVMPYPNLKEEWVRRCINRGNDEKFVALIENMWDKWTSFESQKRWSPKARLFLSEGQYISDITFTLETYLNIYGSQLDTF